MGDVSKLFHLQVQAQGRLEALQADLASRQIETAAGAGLVRATVDGRGTVTRIRIDPAVFAGHDAELLGDLVLAAVAEGQRRAADVAAAELHRLPELGDGPATS